jgi:hypothetical protein
MSAFDASRRDVMKGAAAAFATALPERILAGGYSAGMISGTVFENHSGSLGRQPNDPGIAGVLVSNGREVTPTDANGRYTLPVQDESVIFVIKPTGYALPLDNQLLPQFYYIHQPSGSPQNLNLRFGGIEPTGPLPDMVDFGLTKAAEPRKFDVIAFTDPQPESHAEVDFIRDDVVNSLIGTTAAFGITTGDIMFDDLSLYPRLNRIIAQIGLPWFNIGGNHDLNFEAPGAKYSRETYKRIFGPNYYAFEYGGVLFLMLDNVDYQGPDPAKPRSGGEYEGLIGERQLTFIANVLKESPTDRLVVTCMHIPLRTYQSNNPAENTADYQEFLKLISGRPNTLSLAGHTHTTEHHYFGAQDGYYANRPHHHHVMTAVSGSWWSGPYDHRGIAVADSRDGSPNGFHIISIDGSSYSTRFQPANEPNARQMRITLESEFHGDRKEVLRDFRMGQLLGSPISQENAFATTVVVNFFDGGPRTNVEYRIGKRDPVRMERVRRPDPFVEEEFARNEATKKPWVKAEPSSHIWVARLPTDLGAGTHCIAVRVVDEYGREHRDHLVVEVTAAEANKMRQG